MKLSELMAALPKLNQEELITLRAACDRLVKVPVDAVDETTDLYNAMAGLVGVRLSFRDFHNVQTYKTWSKSAPAVVAFIEQLYPEAKKVVKIAMMVFLLEALITDLKERGVPITIGTLTANLERLPQVFDVSFPDYRQNGLAYLVLNAMVKGPA